MATLTRPKKSSEKIPAIDVKTIFEACIGCKWTLHVLKSVRDNITRPGELERSADGLTMKVLQQRLKKLMKFGILNRTAHATIPPRVEYHLTDFGDEFLQVLDQISVLHDRHFGKPALPATKRSRK